MQSRVPLAALLAVLASPAFAAQQTVTLVVPGMSCAACPIAVKKALTRVDGVTHAEVDYDKRQAVVRFDDAKTDVEKLTRATADAGYPSTLKKPTK
jgi:mercuric ion binding protein